MNYQGMLDIMRTVKQLYNTSEATSPYICDIITDDVEGDWGTVEKNAICKDIKVYIDSSFSVAHWLGNIHNENYEQDDQPVIDARKEMIATLIKRYEDALEAQQ